jgi:predicted nucleotidyltransferase
MTVLLAEQADAVREIQDFCGRLTADVVVIGAVAYRLWVQDQHRTTEDVDLVVALDLVDLPRLTDPLIASGWRRDRRREHRWISPNGARIDLLPAGVRARRDGHLDWPLAETRMSLVGFDHVFQDAVERELAPGLVGKVVPLVVLTLLKGFVPAREHEAPVCRCGGLRYFSFAYSARACCRMGTSGSASFHSARKSW